MHLQNRTINQNRDFEAETSITAGRDVNPYSGKHIDIADFIIEAGTNVHFYAGEEIKLEPGFETGDGTEFETFLGVDPCTKGKLNSNSGINCISHE